MSDVTETDHLTAKYLLEQKVISPDQYRGLHKLRGLDYEIQYKKGKENVVADALSYRDQVDSSSVEVFMAVTIIYSCLTERVKNPGNLMTT